MNSAWFKIKIAVLTSLFTVGIVSMANARPTYGGTCVSCHSNTGKVGSAMDWTPLAISVEPGSTGSISFNITTFGVSNRAAISVQDLQNPLLNASIVAGPTTWTYNDESHGQAYVSNLTTELGTFTLDFAIGAGATPGVYPIGVSLAASGGGGSALRTGFNTTPGFTITVIPEPASLGLLLMGASAVFFRRAKRKRAGNT